MADFESSPRSSKRRKILHLDSPKISPNLPSRLVRVTKTTPTALGGNTISKQSVARDAEDSLDSTTPSRNLRRKGRASETKLPPLSARLRSRGAADKENISVSTRVVGHENRTSTPDHVDGADADLLQDIHDEVQATPSKRGKRKYGAEFTTPSKDTTPQTRSATANNAEIRSGKGLLGVGGPVNGEPDGAKGKLKRPSRSKSVVNEEQKDSTKIRKNIDSRVAEPDAVEVEQSPGTRSSGRTRRQPQSHPLNLEQAAKPVLPSTPASGKKKGRPRKAVSNAAANDQVNGDPEILPEQIKSPGRGEEGELEIEHNRLADATVHYSQQKSSRKQISNQIAQPPSEADPFIPIPHKSLDENVQQSLKIAGSKLQALLAEDTSDNLIELKTRILEGLTGKKRLPLVHLDQEYQKVHQLLEQTVLAGEGNSMLIVGARGTGKTTLVETAISDLAFLHYDKFHVVRLNGFIQTDDKLALREIWRQLGREMEVEEETTTGRSNYADTLTSLLALLSHPAEGTDSEFPDHTAKSVIFIIDEFDLFASHPRQTLLYNLFDVAQSRNAPIAVLGLTTKIDVVESLEKRVKSRFGQRYVHISSPRTFTAFQTICKSALIPQSTSSSIGTTTTIAHRLTHTNPNLPPLLSAWADYIEALFTEDPILQTFLMRIYTLSKSTPTFLTASLLPISLLPKLPTGLSFASQSLSLSPPDSKLNLLPGLSNLDLSLLIAAARLDIVLDSDLCTFGMAYEEYVALASRVKVSSSAAGQMATGAGARVWSVEIARAAWERLVVLELVVPAIGGGGGGGGAGAGAGETKGEGSRMMWRVDVSLEEIAPSVEGLGAVMGKWCREI